MRDLPGAAIEDMDDYIKPTLKKQPDNAILHFGHNNAPRELGEICAREDL